MGYSIAIRPRSKKLQEKMIKFMEKNYKAPHVLFDEGDYSSSSEVPTDDLSYDNAKLTLGFDYSCMPEYEHDYVFAVLRWMSLKIGRKRKWKNMPTSVPYIVYDGFEAWPVIVEGTIPIEEIPEDKRWAIYTEQCENVLKYRDAKAKKHFKARIKFIKELFGVKGHLPKITEEIKRLDELWENA